MRRYLLAFTLLVLTLLLFFLVLDHWRVAILDDPSPWLQGGGPVAAILGVGLLIADVIVPVPSSLIMVVHGALFGIFAGTVLSVAGGLGAALVGFAIGRCGEPLLAKRITASERRRAEELLSRWSLLAVVVTRPVPVLAEVVAILAGTSTMSWRKMTCASAVGLLPAATLYAWAGAVAATPSHTLLVLALCLLVGSTLWGVGQLFPASRKRI